MGSCPAACGSKPQTHAGRLLRRCPGPMLHTPLNCRKSGSLLSFVRLAIQTCLQECLGLRMPPGSRTDGVGRSRNALPISPKPVKFHGSFRVVPVAARGGDAWSAKLKMIGNSPQPDCPAVTKTPLLGSTVDVLSNVSDRPGALATAGLPFGHGNVAATAGFVCAPVRTGCSKRRPPSARRWR